MVENRNVYILLCLRQLKNMASRKNSIAKERACGKAWKDSH
jgi:hypothetical protein